MGMFSNITMGRIIRFFFMRAIEGLVLILILLFLPNLPPFSKFETPYRVSSTMPLEGKLAVNEKLSDIELWHHNMVYGPETFATFDGELYTALQTGEIVKLTGNKHISPIIKFGKACKYFEEEKCGRPLSIAFDKTGAMFAADAYYGIYKVDVKTGEKLQLVTPDVEISGKKPKLFNSIAVATTGEIYWTDSSTEFMLNDGVYSILADASGRFIKYDPQTKRNTVLIDQLHFPNGVLLSKNEDYVIVSVSNRNALLKYHLKGTKTGQHEVFIDGLPGMPDNLKSDGYGGILVTMVATHDSSFPNLAQTLGPFPWIRKLISRGFGLLDFSFKMIDRVYPNDLAKIGMHMVGHFSVVFRLPLCPRATVLHISESGEILDSFHTTKGKISGLSEAFIFNDHLLLGAPFNEFIGRIPLSKLGLKKFPVEPKVQSTQAPTVSTTPQPKTTQASKTTTTSQTPKTTTTTTETPKPTTTEIPKTTPTTQAPKITPTTQAPKIIPTTEAPKTTSTTQSPKTTPTPQVSKTTTQPATTKQPEQKHEAPRSAQAPKPTSTTTKPIPKATKEPAAIPKRTEAPKATPKATEAPKVAPKATEATKAVPKATETPVPQPKPAAQQTSKQAAKPAPIKPSEAPSRNKEL